MSQTIKYVHIKNFKGIKEVEANNLSRFVAVFGKNGAGKTSFIEAIKSAIKLEKGGNAKVRIGEEKGEIEVHFDDFVIKRIIGSKGDLKVEHNGELVSQPQSRLDSVFLGTIGDPNKFLNLHNKEKLKYLLETQGMKLDYDVLEEKRSPLFETRKNIHRTYLAKKEEVDKTDTSSFDELTDAGSVDIADLQNKLENIQEHNSKYYELTSRLEKGENVVNNIHTEIKQIEGSIETLERQLVEQREKLLVKTTDHARANNLKISIEEEIQSFDKQDPAEVLEQINQYNQSQQGISDIRANKSLYDRQIADRDRLDGARRDYDDQITVIEEAQNKLVEGINIGYDLKLVEGNMFVLVDKKSENWIALDELNKALQLEIGVDICLNGPNKVKIITIEDANALDPSTLERLKDKIEKYDAQCFLETVYSTGYEEITITDGISKEPLSK